MQHFFTKIASLLLLSFLSAGFFSKASAQSISGEEIKAQFVKDWERAKSYTLDYLNTMPADKYSFKAVDSIRSFAQQMLHLASGNIFLITTATGEKPGNWPAGRLENSTTAQTKDSVVYYVSLSYDFAIESVKKSDPGKYGEQITFNKQQITRFAGLLKAFEHQTHHRGQTTIYIRLQGIRPPNERLM
jgi:uncharacterized damage-inducible protein DinB